MNYTLRFVDGPLDGMERLNRGEFVDSEMLAYFKADVVAFGGSLLKEQYVGEDCPGWLYVCIEQDMVRKILTLKGELIPNCP